MGTRTTTKPMKLRDAVLKQAQVKHGPPCSVCHHKLLGEIDDCIREGLPTAALLRALHERGATELTLSRIVNHRRYHVAA